MDENRYLDEIAGLWPQPGEPPAKEIVDLCLAAVAEYPESSTLWYDLGIIMRRCGGEYAYTDADYLRCFETSVRCDCTNAEAYQELGYVLDVFFDDYGKAEEAFRKAIELGARHESYFGLARVLAQVGRTDDAIKCLSEDRCPCHDHPEIKKLRAEILDGSWWWEESAPNQ
jgi:tetratricopeptide (TPR) repeat protein